MTKELASESDATPCSGPAWKGPADERDVQGTGVPILAELRARAIAYQEARMLRSLDPAYAGVEQACERFVRWIDELCEDQGRDKAGVTKTTSEAVP
jgi:hypothetical protein